MVGELAWSDSVVLVTGGTGSFGRAFAKRILASDRCPRRLIILSRDELKQHEMRVGGFDHENLRFFIGDVRDEGRLRRAMQGVDVVVHAAALKQVPACEYNPMEAIQTNIMGARSVIEAALDTEVRRVIALSSDKAVNPVNLYGATKLCAEKLFVQSNAYSGPKETRFSCVRYGNVVGSRGSVLPIFLEQARAQKPLTITDARMTRFWLTIGQGVDFVLDCVERMQGGEVFVPKIPSMKIVDLAKAVAPGSPVEEIGIRPGEKLHEVLVSEDEARHTVEAEGMFVIHPTHPWWKTVPDPTTKPVPAEFSYRSDTNDEWLSAAGLLELIQGIDIP